MNKTRVVFMGTPDFAVPVLEGLIENYEVVGVVSQPDKRVGRKQVLVNTPIKEVALKHNILVLQPEKIREDYEDILKLNPDIIVTCAYGQIIPSAILDYPKLGCINVHASLLPKLRGGAPIHKAIIDGYSKTGITIMYMDKKMDNGDVISTSETEILDSDNLESLHDRLSIMGRDLLLETMPSIINGTNKRIKQNEDEVTYAYNIKREEEHIDLSKTRREVFNQIRGLSPVPGANLLVDGEEFKIYGSESFISIMVSKFYLVYYFLWAYFFLLYIFVISFREKSEYLLQKKFTKTIIILTSLFICLIILIMPIQITYEDNVAYSSGLSVNMVYGLCFIMVGIMLYCLLRNLKKISTKEYIPLLTFMVLSTFCMIIQKTYPEITLMLMCHSIVTSLMYFTIENPDVKMVKELEVAKNEAEKANHAKSEFLSSMSHELRTPLNAIVCFSELLESKEGLDSESKDFARDIVSASHNLLDLVNGVLDISKIEAGKMELINKEYNSFENLELNMKLIIPNEEL